MNMQKTDHDVFGRNQFLDSREVAEMVEKQHKHLLRDIHGYIREMKKLGELKNELSPGAPKVGEPKIGPSSNVPKINPSDFFIPSTYISDQGKELPNFLITKKGCEFVANKLTGEKGTKFTAMYVTRFNIMEERESTVSIQTQFLELENAVAAIGSRLEDYLPSFDRRIHKIEQQTGFTNYYLRAQAYSNADEAWVKRVSPRVGALSGFLGLPEPSTYSQIYSDMRLRKGIDVDVYRSYYQKLKKVKTCSTLSVVSTFPELRNAFEEVLSEALGACDLLPPEPKPVQSPLFLRIEKKLQSP